MLCGLLLLWSSHQAIALAQSARQPVDAILVLGGSIRREIYAAQLAQTHPNLPILISGGSAEPCIWLIFRREAAPMQNIWIEPCARSTLDNYRFSTPTLERWGIHHLKLITSGTHTFRALALGRTILAGHGIWLSLERVPETGRPGNQESKLKTALDLVRGFGWMIVSQVYQPECPELHRLDKINLAAWDAQTFVCEEQGQVKIPPRLETWIGQ